MNAHRIHLKGPWEYAWHTGDNAASPAFPITGRVKMPCDWRSVFGEQAGTARFTRRFHKPTGLEAGDSIWLMFDGIGGEATVQLNRVLLQPAKAPVAPSSNPSLAFEITGRMEPSNEIAVELTFDPPGNVDVRGGLWGPVLIVIVGR